MVRPRTIPAVGYTLVLPPGWRHIPLRRGTDAAVREILDEVFGRLPRELSRDKTGPFRRELERQLGKAAARARNNSAMELYLPVEPMHGAPVAASFVVSEVSFGSAEVVDPALIVSHLASGSRDTRPVMVDGAMGVRIERIAAPDPAAGIEHGSRRVDYVVSVPEDPDRWLAVAFSTLGGGDPGDQYAKLLAELFDAIMSTFRWSREEADSAQA
jgi:hypothetical protein